jgi:hypothetical protein
VADAGKAPSHVSAVEDADRRDRVLARVMLTGIVVLVVLAVAVNLIFFLTPYVSARAFDFFQLDAAHNPGAWFSSVQLFLCAFLALQLALREGNARRRSWVAVAVLCVAMSIDEGLSVHEMLTNLLKARLHLDRFSAVGGIVVALPLVGVVASTLFGMLATLPDQARRRLILAAMLFVTGAVGVETVGARYASVYNLAPGFYALATVEEALEMAGVWVFFGLLLSLSRLPPAELHASWDRDQRPADQTIKTLKECLVAALPVLAVIVVALLVIERASFQIPSDVRPMTALPSLRGPEGSPGVTRTALSTEWQAGRFATDEDVRLKWQQAGAVAAFDVPVRAEAGGGDGAGSAADGLELYFLRSSFSGTFEVAVDGRVAATVALCQRGHRLYPAPPLVLSLPTLPASAATHRVTFRLIGQDERCPTSSPELHLSGWRLTTRP